MNEFDLLQQRLDEHASKNAPDDRMAEATNASPQPVSGEKASNAILGMTKRQWAVLGDDIYIPIGATVRDLPAGVYTLGQTGEGIITYRLTKINTDTLIEFDDHASQRVLKGIDTFWKSKAKFDAFGMLFKRGILLWGNPGSGKTAMVSMLIEHLVQMGGMVVLVQVPELAVKALMELRRIEPNRPLIVVLEDIEEMIRNHGEHNLLGLLDGEHQVNNVVVIGTTNYPELLGDRIVNRPSRFDEVIFVDMPDAASRRKYLTHVLKGTVAVEEIEKWVEATNNLSVAHLRELIVATQCLDRPYEEVVERLRKMKIRPNSEKKRESGGFGMSGGGGAGQLSGVVRAVPQQMPTSTGSLS